jgi:glutathione S-transferase
MMKLFYAPGSSSLLPHIVLYEAGSPFSAVKVDEHTKEIEGGGDYRKINPLGYLPTLVLDDGTLLIERPRHRPAHRGSGTVEEPRTAVRYN